MKVFTSEQMQAIDRVAEERHRIPSSTLMDNAGRQIAAFMLRRRPDLASRKLAILCGKGNNGGDGITAARHLRDSGVASDLFLLAPASSLMGAARWALEQAAGAGLVPEEILSDEDWSRLQEKLPGYDLICDALLGTGTRGGARGLVLKAIQGINESGVEVIAVDIPSGLSGSSHQIPGESVAASATAVLAGLKIANVLEPARGRCGAIEVLEIGIPPAALASEEPALRLVTPEHVSGLIPKRASAGHKGSYGHVLVMAGSRGKSGAAVLLAEACLRSGAGLVTIACPASAQPVVASSLPEAMTVPLPEDEEGLLADGAAGLLRELMEERDVLAAGPGIGTGHGVARCLAAVLGNLDRRAVLDADALNLMAADPALLPAKDLPVIFTPHPGEAARLLGRTTREVQENRPEAAAALAGKLGGTVVLKGHQTLIAQPGHPTCVNITGNPGMATGGSGDVLTGICAAWLGQGLAPADAAVLAVFAHGLAGDRAAEEMGQISITAGDIIDHLSDAYLALGAPAKG